MKLATYKKNHQGFYDRQIKEFEKFPTKDECLKMGLIVSHPIADDKIELHKDGNYTPLYIVDTE